MSYLLAFLLAVAVAACAYLAFVWWHERSTRRQLEQESEEYRTTAERRQQQMETELEKRRRQVARLAKWESVADAVDKARHLLASAEAKSALAEANAQNITNDARQQADRMLEEARVEAREKTAGARAKAKQLAAEAETALATATKTASATVLEANRRAEEIAGKAYDVVRNAELYEQTARAMKNIIEGYGDEYLKPAASLLDELAEAFGHKDAGRQLKLAREHTESMVDKGQASRCEYVETSRREGAERFVLDAFNGRVDSILSRASHDNYGKLEQEIQDAFATVNFGGKAFREARITDEYLAARLAELKWAAVAQELRRREQEEQREFRNWIREEQKAQRELEKAAREAAKEEDLLRKALAQAQAEVAAASEEQRAQYEAQLAELGVKLKEAEERNQRARSMAQQTRRGHVYIISNIGSFGENVYKIGLTRRLDPLERVKELGDASVPFEFDVHAILYSDDAPALETQLHKHFILTQMNKVNHRKEFFRANIADIRREVESLGVEAKWTMLAEAREYHETLAIERVIEGDTAAREAWLNRQLTLDPVEVREVATEDGESSDPS
ncbi:MAG: DUF4041 domain-containing protein [Phycisphaerae bacterium]|jgi:hypothetical protein